jgi:hypothetical protein
MKSLRPDARRVSDSGSRLRALITALIPLVLLADAVAANDIGATDNATPPDQYCISPVAISSCPYYKVSIAALVANPSQYDGREVLVSGYLHLEFEGNAIYFHEEDYRYGIVQNGLWVSWRKGASPSPQDGCQSNRYVQVRGTFSAKETGHMGLWSGSIKDIYYCTAQAQIGPPGVVTPHSRSEH